MKRFNKNRNQMRAAFVPLILLITFALLIPCCKSKSPEKRISQKENIEKRINELSSLRSNLENKNEEIVGLKDKYQYEIEELEEEVIEEKNKNNIGSYQKAVENRKIAYDLSLIRIKKAYIQKLDEIQERVVAGNDELVFLKRKAETDLGMVELLGDDEAKNILESINIAINKYLPSAGELVINERDLEFTPVNQIWDEIVKRAEEKKEELDKKKEVPIQEEAPKKVVSKAEREEVPIKEEQVKKQERKDISGYPSRFTDGTVYVKQRSHTDSYTMMGQTQPAKDEISELWVYDRMLVVNQGEARSLLTDMRKNIMYWVNHKDRTYVEMTLPVNMNYYLTDGAAEFMSMEYTNVRVNPNGQKRKIGNWNCDGYDVRMDMVYKKYNINYQMSSNMWACVDVPFDWKNLAIAWRNIYKTQMMSDAAIREFEKIKGYTVLTETTVDMMGVKLRMFSEVTEISKNPAREISYSVPRGYVKKEKLSDQDFRTTGIR